MNDKTAAETTDGTLVLVELDEAVHTIVFTDDDGTAIVRYDFDAFAGVSAALALDLGNGIVIDADTVAQIQQWANLDAHGLLMRGR